MNDSLEWAEDSSFVNTDIHRYTMPGGMLWNDSRAYGDRHMSALVSLMVILQALGKVYGVKKFSIRVRER